MTYDQAVTARRDYNDLQNEGHEGYNPYDDAVSDAISDEVAAMIAADKIIWTREVTIDRRAAWNSRVKAGEFSRGGKIDIRLIVAAEQAQGWDVNALRTAISNHNL